MLLCAEEEIIFIDKHKLSISAHIIVGPKQKWQKLRSYLQWIGVRWAPQKVRTLWTGKKLSFCREQNPGSPVVPSSTGCPNSKRGTRWSEHCLNWFVDEAIIMSQTDCQTSWRDNDDHHNYCHHHHHHHILAAFVAFGYRFDTLTSPDRTTTVKVWEQNALKKIAEPRQREREREEVTKQQPGRLVLRGPWFESRKGNRIYWIIWSFQSPWCVLLNQHLP